MRPRQGLIHARHCLIYWSRALGHPNNPDPFCCAVAVKTPPPSPALGPNISCLFVCLLQPLSPTTHSPSSLVGGGGGDYLRGDTKTVALTTLNKEGQRKKRHRSHGDAQQSVGAMSAVLAPTPIAFVPVHTLDKTPPFAGSPLPRVLTETASASNLTGAVSAENMLSKNSINSLRPRTSTGCERGTRSATFPDTRGVKGVQDSRKREVRAICRPIARKQACHLLILSS